MVEPLVEVYTDIVLSEVSVLVVTTAAHRGLVNIVPYMLSS